LEAKEAFFTGKAFSHILLEQVVREALLEKLMLRHKVLWFDLRRVATSGLLEIAGEVGINLCYPLSNVASLMATLEGHRAQCSVPPPSMLYAACRIFEEVVNTIRSTPDEESKRLQAEKLLRVRFPESAL
jgi:hypothetical protein